MIIKKRNLIKIYNLPKKVIFVKNVLFQIKDLELLLINKEFVLRVNMLSLKETKLTGKSERSNYLDC